MTPDEHLYREMWLAECWKPCREYKPTQRSKPVEKPRDRRRKKAS